MANQTQMQTKPLKVYQYLWRLIRFRPHYYLLDIGPYTIHFATAVIVGLIFRAYFNGLTGEGSPQLDTWSVVGWQMAQMAVSLGLLFVAVIATINLLQHSMALMIRNMIARILELPGSRALPVEKDGRPMPVGKVISTLRDDTEHLAETVIAFDDVIAALVTAVISFIIMARIHLGVTLGMFIPMAIIIYISHRLSLVARHYRQLSRAATSEVTGMIADMFNAVQAIKVANAEERIINRFRQINDRRRDAMVKDRLVLQLVNALSNSAVDIGVGFILLLAAGAMYRGQFTVGDFALFASYVWPSTQLMRRIGNLIAMYRQNGVSARRMETIMQGAEPGAVVAHHPVYLRSDPPPLPFVTKTAEHRLELLEVRGLTCRHPAAEEQTDAGVFDISFQIPRGAFVVVTGRIGSGKTTLLKAILGLLPIEAGEVYWNGQQVTDLRHFMVPPRVAYTGQVPRLFSDTIRNNILLGLPEEQVDLGYAIKTAVLEKDLADMDYGLETMVGPRGIRLSGGQIQRTAAARMFVRNAELLVFDDLSSALDVETERLLWQRLLATAENGHRPTCLVVSHRRIALQMADRILVLQNGRITDAGTLDELLVRSVEMQALWQGEVGNNG